jgi:hypothetical protein
MHSYLHKKIYPCKEWVLHCSTYSVSVAVATVKPNSSVLNSNLTPFGFYLKSYLPLVKELQIFKYK